MITIGESQIGPSTPIEITEKSRKVLLTFDDAVAYQIVNESYTTFDKYEETVGISNNFALITKSKYLDFINAKYDLYITLRGMAKHYRIWTCDDVIDVISHDEPKIQWIE